MEGVYKSDGSARQATAESFALDQSSISHLKLGPGSVGKYEHRDLVLVPRDGKEKPIPDLYIASPGGGATTWCSKATPMSGDGANTTALGRYFTSPKSSALHSGDLPGNGTTPTGRTRATTALQLHRRGGGQQWRIDDQHRPVPSRPR